MSTFLTLETLIEKQSFQESFCLLSLPFFPPSSPCFLVFLLDSWADNVSTSFSIIILNTLWDTSGRQYTFIAKLFLGRKKRKMALSMKGIFLQKISKWAFIFCNPFLHPRVCTLYLFLRKYQGRRFFCMYERGVVWTRQKESICWSRSYTKLQFNMTWLFSYVLSCFPVADFPIKAISFPLHPLNVLTVKVNVKC